MAGASLFQRTLIHASLKHENSCRSRQWQEKNNPFNNELLKDERSQFWQSTLDIYRQLRAGVGTCGPRDHFTMMALLRSENPSGMRAKLRTVAATNNRVHMPRSLYCCLFAPHIHLGVVLCAHPVRGEPRIQRNANREVATARNRIFITRVITLHRSVISRHGGNTSREISFAS